MMGPNNMTAIGGTGLQFNNMNSAIAESEMDIEFGYCSEEESIFQSFSQDMERMLPKIKRTFSLKDEAKGTKVNFKDILRRVTHSHSNCDSTPSTPARSSL